MTILTLLLALGAAIAEPQTPVPLTIESDGVGAAKPAWVSAKAALDETGVLRRELFEPYQLAALDFALENAVRADGDPCAVHLSPPPLEQFIEVDSLDALVKESRHVMSGTVVNAADGFLFGVPGTLYAVRVGDALSRKGLPSTAYLFLAGATIDMKDGAICASRHAAAVPVTVGDRVLAFVHFKEVGRGSAVLQIDPRHQLIVQHAGKTRGPQVLSLPANATVESVMEEVRRRPHGRSGENVR